MSAVADRLHAALLRDRARGREAVRALQERAARDPYLQTTAHSRMLGRPLFLGAGERDALQRDLSALVDLLLDLPDRLFGGDVARMCDMTGLDAHQRAAVAATWRDREVVLSRADLLRGADGFKAIEVNVHSSLGGIDSGPWHRAFVAQALYREFLAAEGLDYVDPMDGVARALRAATQRRGLGDRPTVAIVDWPTTFPIYAARLRRVARLLESHGFSAFACHAGELELQDGRLAHRGRPIDVLYRIFLLGDVPEAPQLLDPILAAHASGDLLLAMGFGAELVGNKASLALLSEGVEGSGFTDAERALVRRLVPWTRLTLTAGEELVELAVRRREQLVLKPADGHAARDVLLGSAASPAEWRSALDRAIGAFWVLQERVRPLPELVPTVDTGDLSFDEVEVNWGVFVMSGRYGGSMLRAVPVARAGLIGAAHTASVGCCFCEA